MDKIKLSAVVYACNEEAAGKGKDSFSVFFKDENSGIIAVYSGNGDSEHTFFKNRSNANVSSMISAYVTDRFYENGRFSFDGTDSEKLCRDMKSVFHHIRQDFEVKSNSPVSASCAVTSLKIGDEAVECELLWAGNARIYILDRFGLHQLTKDDCKLGDDLVISAEGGEPYNYINENINFHINEMKINITEPCAVVTATQGAYSGVKMPAEFEYKILNSLYYSDSVEIWQEKFRKSLCGNGDCSVATGLFGFEDFGSLWKFFSDRYENLTKLFIEPAKTMDGDGIRSLWNEYRKTYLGNGDMQ